MRFVFDMDFDEEALAEMDAEFQEEIYFQRRLTAEKFARINPNGKLLDFNVFKRANAGDLAAIDAVMEYHKYKLEGYMNPESDEIDLQCQADLLRAFREAFV